jgi:hypothetical protein
MAWNQRQEKRKPENNGEARLLHYGTILIGNPDIYF